MDVFTTISQRSSVRAYIGADIGEVPVVIVACGIETISIKFWAQQVYTVDIYYCAFLILQAYELGLRTCWIGAFKEYDVKKILKITESTQVVVMTLLGYSNAPSPRSPERVSIKSFVLSNRNEKEIRFQVELATPEKKPLFLPLPFYKKFFLDKFLLNR